jgi:hypothetical protein
MKRMLHGMLAFVAVFLMYVPGASAQVDRATLSGVVRDTGGGVVPGATVTVTNIATNLNCTNLRLRLVCIRCSTWCPFVIKSKCSSPGSRRALR